MYVFITIWKYLASANHVPSARRIQQRFSQLDRRNYLADLADLAGLVAIALR